MQIFIVFKYLIEKGEKKKSKISMRGNKSDIMMKKWSYLYVLLKSWAFTLQKLPAWNGPKVVAKTWKCWECCCQHRLYEGGVEIIILRFKFIHFLCVVYGILFLDVISSETFFFIKNNVRTEGDQYSIALSNFGLTKRVFY